MNAFKQLLQGAASHRPVGTWIMSASPIVAEAIGLAGFDWAVVDMEHSPLGIADVVHLLQAVAGTPMAPVLRVPWNDAVTLKRVLDAGANTVLVPFVQNADEARRAVAATRYPPQGMRGVAAMHRASRFGTVPDYLKRASAETCVVVQIETPEAMQNLEAIAAVDGVDCIFIGPGDLAASMGLIGEIGHPQVQAHLKEAAQTAARLGKPCGIVMGQAEAVNQCIEVGYSYVAVASDLGMLMGRAGEMLAKMRPAAALKA